ncbi:hypothetical protein DWU99_19520 [Dyella psychrodurans]|uniref:Uncharacterized protein n=1 Tax=Dyella psychrodurans TaxID=1927960 RepID=A0A370WW23_9GAMM|nr:hypothetical protein DWU99_19520 [Dyella psychrodurans]
MCATASSGLICAVVGGASAVDLSSGFLRTEGCTVGACFFAANGSLEIAVMPKERGRVAFFCAAFLDGALLTGTRPACFDNGALATAVFFTVFFATTFFAVLLTTVFLPTAFFTAFFAAFAGAFFAAFLLATAFLGAFFGTAAGLLTAFFLVELTRLDTLLAADFFAADLRVVAMRGYSAGGR